MPGMYERGKKPWQAMTHELTITHDLQFIARPFCVKCETCGFKASAETHAEAKRIVESHQRLEEQKETLKSRGFLK